MQRVVGETADDIAGIGTRPKITAGIVGIAGRPALRVRRRPQPA